MANIPETPKEVAQVISRPDFKAILKAYPISVNSYNVFFQRLYGGIRNAVFLIEGRGGKFVLTIYKLAESAENRVRRNLEIYQYLQPRGFPVPEVVFTNKRELFVQKPLFGADRFVSLHKYIGGQQIFPHRGKELDSIGKFLSDLHTALRGFPKRDLLCRSPVEIGFGGQSTVLHMDFARGNILFDEERNISAVLDFEEAVWGAPILDIAKSLALISKDNQEDSFAFIKKKFLSGYRVGSEDLQDLERLPSLMDYFSQRII